MDKRLVPVKSPVVLLAWDGDSTALPLLLTVCMQPTFLLPDPSQRVAGWAGRKRIGGIEAPGLGAAGGLEPVWEAGWPMRQHTLRDGLDFTHKTQTQT